MTDERVLREQIVETMQEMARAGLNRGTSGNVSARLGDAMLVTPSGITPDALAPDHIVIVQADGSFAGDLRPSSEWRMHRGLLDRRPDISAVVHCHSRYATTLACAGLAIPPLHYMVAVSGRASVPVAPYASFGTGNLAELVVEAMGEGYACLMANHGQIALGGSLRRALAVAEEIEEQAAVYWGTLSIGGPKLLAEEQIAEVMTLFRSYGQPKKG